MKAALLTALGRIETHDTPEPKLKTPRDVLLRIESVGVCGSDVHYFRSGRIGPQLVVQYPFLLGHECAGRVVELGAEVKHLSVGQRVAVDPLVACGQCDQCRQGRPHTCRKQAFLGCPGQLPGSLGEFLVMPSECCFPVPDSLNPAQTVMVEPLSIGVYAQRMSRSPAGSKVAVLGSGPIGLCVLLAMRAAVNCTVYATDLVEDRLDVAQRCGANWTGNPDTTDIVAAIKKLEPNGLDIVFECAGQQETLDQGVELLRPGGTLLIVGIPEEDRITFSVHTMRRKELTITNVRRQNHCVTPTIDLLARGAISVDPLVTHHFPLAETQAAFDLVAGYRDGVVKAIIDIS